MGDAHADRAAPRRDADAVPACARRFVEAMCVQLGEGEDGRVRALLHAAAAGEADGGALLHDDGVLLAAAYSNLDLLPAGCDAGDQVAAAVRDALARLDGA